MKVLRPFTLILLLCIGICVACSNGDTQTNTPATQTPPQSDASDPAASLPAASLSEAKNQIQLILLKYYNDLAAEELDEQQYFAPMVDKFYSQKNKSRADIGQIIRNGFAQVSDRRIVMDRESLNVEQKGNTYTAEFGGLVSFFRSSDNQEVSERFRNRVVFNKDFKIISYEAIEDDSRQLRQAKNKSNDLSAIKEVIQGFKGGNYETLSNYIHPELGFYYVTRPGAIDAADHFNELQQMFDHAATPWIQENLQQLTCIPRTEASPEFDCEGFAKQGCFWQASAEYNRVTKIYKLMEDSDFLTYSEAEWARARRVEAAITHELVLTHDYLSLAFGQIEGKWYLLVVDPAKFDCSA